jgi:hypothetical protein
MVGLALRAAGDDDGFLSTVYVTDPTQVYPSPLAFLHLRKRLSGVLRRGRVLQHGVDALLFVQFGRRGRFDAGRLDGRLYENVERQRFSLQVPNRLRPVAGRGRLLQ